MKWLGILSVLSGLFSCCSSNGSTSGHNSSALPLLGKWEYEETTYKNTSVRGTIEFKADGTFALAIKARDDYPMDGNFSGNYDYMLDNGVLKTGYDKGYGLDPYFVIEGDNLYLSRQPFKKAESDYDKGYLRANWSYKLKRVK